jgi:hypothetical protein
MIRRWWARRMMRLWEGNVERWTALAFRCHELRVRPKIDPMVGLRNAQRQVERYRRRAER